MKSIAGGIVCRKAKLTIHQWTTNTIPTRRMSSLLLAAKPLYPQPCRSNKLADFFSPSCFRSTFLDLLPLEFPSSEFVCSLSQKYGRRSCADHENVHLLLKKQIQNNLTQVISLINSFINVPCYAGICMLQKLCSD